MRTYVLSHVSDGVLLRDLNMLVGHERIAMAGVLAHIAEVDERRLYLPAGYPSMYAYCVGVLRFPEQAAKKRIRAGRTARQFPAIFDALAEGRVHLSAVVLLKPYLTPDNAGDLLAAAAHQTSAEIEQLLARRFPKADVPTRLDAVGPAPLLTSTTEPVSPGTPESVEAQVSPRTLEELACTDPLSPGTVEATVPRPRVTPLSAESYALQFTIGKDTHDKLRYVQALMSTDSPRAMSRRYSTARSMRWWASWRSRSSRRPRSHGARAARRPIPATSRRT
jgi:hypothetical protein